MTKVRPSYPARERQWLGILATVAVILLLEVAAYFIGPFRSQGLILLLTVIFVSYWSGLRAGLISCAILLAYIGIVYSFPISNFNQDPQNFVRALVGSAVVFPAFALLFGIVQGKLRNARMREFDAEQMRGLVVESSMDAIIGMKEDGTITLWNPSAEALFGWTAEEAVGRLLADTILPQQYRDAHNDGLNRFRKSGVGVIFGKRLELTGLKKNGEEFPVELAVSAHKTHEGNVFVGFLRDITERKKAEQAIVDLNFNLETRVEQRTAQLEAANKELEAFSHSVSHDLRSPLRAIDGFSQALLEDYNDKIDNQGKEYLERVRMASQRMAQLIDDLLNLSRVTRAEMNVEEVNLSELAKEIATELQTTDRKRDVDFVIQDKATAKVDRRLLRIALQNLLENAWKFTSKNAGNVKIEFGSKRENGQTVYYVKDNGAGFDMAYADRLFGAFHRLHGAAEFPGTGIGLANVQRIVRRHGGEIRAEGEVGKGAAFYFTLK